MSPFIIRRRQDIAEIVPDSACPFFLLKPDKHKIRGLEFDVEPTRFDAEAVGLNDESIGDDVESAGVEVRPVSFDLSTAV